jgi:GTP-binding protein
MEFLDEAIITIRSGDGGRGCISFRRERFKPKGGPDGGDGGKGGDILVRARKSLYSLSDFRAKKSFRASNGRPGKPKGQFGKDGVDLVIDVPLGTIIQDMHTHEILADLVSDGEEIPLAIGGKGGRGNQRFATPTNRAPRVAQPGLPGVERQLRLTLKFLADIGLVGFPNAGKSTLLSRISMALPRIDAYPFTTLTPNLGVVVGEEDVTAVVADVPGLIQGASAGRGLGHRFLKHIERTRLLVYVLDVTHPCGEDILEDLHIIRAELVAYNPELIKKGSMVVANKMDLHGKQHRGVEEMRRAVEREGMTFHTLSALTGEGVEPLKHMLLEKTAARVPPGGQTKDPRAGIPRKRDPMGL